MLKKFLPVLSFALLLTTAIDAEVVPVQTSSKIAELLMEKERTACSAVKDKIGKGENIRITVRTSIQMGFNACPIVKCAVSAGGDLKEIVTGAVEAGAQTDVVSKCAADAGADLGMLAAYIREASPNLCWFMPSEETQGLGYSQADTPLIPADTILPTIARTGNVSPYTF